MSNPKPTFLDYRANLRPSGLRTTPLSYPAGVRNSAVSTVSTTPSSYSTPSLPAAPSPAPAPAPAALPPTGPSILLYVSGSASPDLSSHLSVLLSTQRVGAVHLVGTKDAVLKQLRTDVYTAAGKLRQDVAVSISLTPDTETLQKAVGEVASRGQKVLGALICEWDDGDKVQSGDLLEMESALLETVWKSSVLTLHTLLKTLLPALSTTSTPSSQPFIYFDTSIQQSPFASASRTALLDSITTSPLTQNMTIGQASVYLKPATPPPAETQSMRSLRIDTHNNGYNAGQSVSPEQSPLFGSESPTKLWASWAAMNDI